MRRINHKIFLLLLLQKMRFCHGVYFVPLDEECVPQTTQPSYKEIDARPIQCLNKCMMMGCGFARVEEGNKCFIEEGDFKVIPSNVKRMMKSYEMKTLSNVAVNKITSASSVYGPSFVASAGADGDMSTMFHSKEEQSPWWMLDLGRRVMVKGIKITARSGLQVRVGSLKIYVSADSPTQGSYASLPLFAEQVGVPQTSSNQYEGPGLCGRYVVVQKQDYDYLEFFEFEVYGL